MALTLWTEAPKTSRHYNSDPRVRAIDELQRISSDHRDDKLGDDWYQEAKKFYTLEGLVGRAPTFRPQVNIPQLQVLSISEATDLTDSSPRVTIYDRATGNTDQERSRAFMEQWRECWTNYHLLFASLWAQFVGIGFMQYGYDPFADSGFGQVWCAKRNPDSVWVDPGASTLRAGTDCTYIVLEDRYYPDQVAYFWPETGAGMQAEPITGTSQASPAAASGMPHKLRMPDGPMRLAVGPNEADELQSDGRLRTRYLFIDDRTIEIVQEQAGGQSAKVVEMGMARDSRGHPTRRLKYPNMRLIVCVAGSSGRVVADGDNPTPGKRFPIVPIYGLPPLDGLYPPPPARYTRDLQSYCEKLATQVFENCVRLNNGIWFVDKGTGIHPESFGGLPGELAMIDDNSRIPQAVFPTPIQAPVLQLIQYLLGLQKELQGHSQSREGSPGAGNLSPELFEASIYQSQRLTRCRARMLAKSIHEMATLQFDYMAQYYGESRAFASNEGGFAMSTWKPVYGLGARTMKLHIDPVSLMPISQAAMRQMAPMLKQEGAIDNQTLLEALEVPDAKGISDRLNREMALAALQKLKRR